MCNARVDILDADCHSFPLRQFAKVGQQIYLYLASLLLAQFAAVALQFTLMVDEYVGPDRSGELNAGREDLPLDIAVLEIPQVEPVRCVYGVI